mgnify:CR=1 FL=1
MFVILRLQQALSCSHSLTNGNLQNTFFIAAERNGGADMPKTITNADRIRAMDDKELAHLLMGHGTFECPVCEIGDQRKCDTECEKHCVKWLQQPAEEADHDL